MGNQVKRIGVLTSGGDAPGMNAAVRAVVRTAVNRGIECIGIRRGWNGLINHDFVPMDSNSVSHIIDKGGTMLYNASLRAVYSIVPPLSTLSPWTATALVTSSTRAALCCIPPAARHL